MDDFVTPRLRSAIHDLDPRWTSPPMRDEKLRLLAYVARDAQRIVRGSEPPVVSYEIGTRGAKAIRGWDPDARRNYAGVRKLLHEIADVLPPGAYNIDRYDRPTVHRRGRRSELSALDLPQVFWEASPRECLAGASGDPVHVPTGALFNAKSWPERSSKRAPGHPP